MHKSILTYCLIFLFSLTLSAQETEPVKQEVKPSLDHGTIDSQFNFMTKKSSNWQGHEVIKVDMLNKYQSNVQDTLKLLKSTLKSSESKLDQQEGEISGLNTEIENLKKQLDETVRMKDSMKFLGMEMTKSSYNTLMWILIIGSLAVAGVCFMLFKRSNVVTVETKQTLEEVREEFDTHRKNALVREQKLARRLQDEVIKNKNLGL
ncbi:tRNA (guanine-N1)-methyltransferase [Marinifilum caeruleilacunae]|uniref:tRNA (Guanine-N1)-methyltransferase n=1 Tax=Marinifilum caeruleilacunae TaxID=2499076 RepID=A0ABX1WRC0_9BACT|nr:tRNA (guanine-N1)-methyltransferase [Marinifilum caeruleilacunae]NOU58630.1 tRNA (guanine-N1)-methyltransferase [Marinifilum caeruleilacunae]